MSVDYQKMYSYLVGQVDDAIEMIGNDIFFQRNSQEDLLQVAEKLKNALLTTEEMYIDD